MPRQPKPYLRKQTKSWYCSIGGRQISLGKDRDAAFEKFYELMGDREQVRNDISTLYELSQVYLDWCQENRKPGTYENHRRYLKQFILAVGKRLRPHQLKKHQITKWLEGMTCGSTSKNDAASVVQRMLNWAVEQDYLSRNPIKGLINKHDKEVHTFAPSTGAKEVLHDKGFKSAQTVEHLVRNTKLHPKLKDQVIWIDEAGLVDVRSMNAVFKIAKQQNARVVLSGDPRQHASPRVGEAMRLLEGEAGLKMARVERIQRQKGNYRKAVHLISQGHEVVDHRTGKTGLLAGFDMLDAMGKIKEISSDNRHAELAKTYLGAIEKKKTALVVAPTHAEAQSVTAEIRSKLQERGKLSTNQKSFTQYRSLNLTEAEKGEARSYAGQRDLVVQFHQNIKGGFQRGDRYRVVGTKEGQVQLESVSGKSHKSLPLDRADRFEVYAESQLQLAAGDKIRFSLGGTTKDQQGRISNGRLDEVQGFDQRGNIVLNNGWTISKDYAHLDLAYVITSHASQGKDRNIAIAAMGSESLPAINAKQFYVTASRGSDDLEIFVDDKAKVRSAIQRSGQQLSATELVKSGRQPSRGLEQQRARQKQRTHQSLRSRALGWWKSVGRALGTREPVGRHRQANTPRENFIDMSPSLGRSRA